MPSSPQPPEDRLATVVAARKQQGLPAIPQLDRAAADALGDLVRPTVTKTRKRVRRG